MYRHDGHRSALKKHINWFLPCKPENVLDENTYPPGEGSLSGCMAFTVSTYSRVSNERVDFTFTVGLGLSSDMRDFDGYCHDLYARGGGMGTNGEPEYAVHTLHVPVEYIWVSESIRAIFAPVMFMLKRLVYGTDKGADDIVLVDSFLEHAAVNYDATHASDMSAVCIVSDGLAIVQGNRVCQHIAASGTVPRQYLFRFTREMLTRTIHATYALNGWFCLIAPLTSMKIKSSDVATVQELLKHTEEDADDEDGDGKRNKEITDTITSATPDGARKTAAMVLITFEASHQGEE